MTQWFNHLIFLEPHRGAFAGIAFAAPLAMKVTFSPALLTRFWTFLRATLSGGLATLADLGVLSVLVSLLHVPARAASVPALLVGGIVNFIGNRTFAFREKGKVSGSLPRQVVLYGVVEIVALLLSALLFDAALRHVHIAQNIYPLVRLATGSIVFFLWSYPLWKRIFRNKEAAAALQDQT